MNVFMIRNSDTKKYMPRNVWCRSSKGRVYSRKSDATNSLNWKREHGLEGDWEVVEFKLTEVPF